MAVSEPYLAFAQDVLAPLAPLRIKRMFGGAGVYSGEVFFAILADDTLYLKADARSRDAYEARGLRPFSYIRKDGRTARLLYYPLPAEILEDPEALVAWAREAVAPRPRDRQRRLTPADRTTAARRTRPSGRGRQARHPR